MKKVLYCDVETTGLNPLIHGIWSLAFLIEINGEVVEKGSYKMQPMKDDKIDKKALEIGGVTEDQLWGFEVNAKIFNEFKLVLESHVSKFNKNDKFYVSGYNLGFDLDFIGEWFRKNGEKYGFGVYTNWKKIDPLPILHWLDYTGIFRLPNYKLSTVCAKFGIELDAHNAWSDINATRDLVKRIETKIKEAK